MRRNFSFVGGQCGIKIFAVSLRARGIDYRLDFSVCLHAARSILGNFLRYHVGNFAFKLVKGDVNHG